MSWLKKHRWSSECRYHHLDAMMVKNINLDYFSLPTLPLPFPTIPFPPLTCHGQEASWGGSIHWTACGGGGWPAPTPASHGPDPTHPPLSTLMLLWSRSFCSLLNSLWPKKVLLIIWPIKKKHAVWVGRVGNQSSSFGGTSSKSMKQLWSSKSMKQLWKHKSLQVRAEALVPQNLTNFIFP